MKYPFSLYYLEKLRLFIRSKSFNPYITLAVFASLLLFSTTPSIKGSKLLDAANKRNIVSAPFGYLKLNINSNTLNYSTEIYFNSNASQGLDPGYDAAILGGSVPAFGIYSFLVQDDNGVPFAVQSLSDTDMNNVVVPLGLNFSQGQDITIAIIENDIPDSISIYLEDRSSETSTLLNTNAYNFTAATDFSGIGRFYLKFEGDALGQPDNLLDDLKIYVDPIHNTILIEGLLYNETHLKLYDINGKALSEHPLNITRTTQAIPLAHLNTGIYIVELVEKTSHKRTEKIIIQ